MPRTVSVSITANTSGFTAGMAKLSASAKSTASGVQSAFGKGFDSIGKNKRNIDTLSSGLGKIGIAAGVGVGLAIKSFADFDSAMSGVAATGSDARANFDALREAAIKAGADTKYSATEAAGGVEALAKAGVSAQDTLGGGLTGALNLAAAGNLDVAGSAEAAASAMNQFGLAGADIPHIADLLAQAAGTAQGEVSDMAGALNQSGLIANQFGLSIDETAQALALFAKNGLVGSDAGTSFKTMLTSLYAPSGAAAETLDKLQVSAYDATGAIKPIGVVTDELKGKLDALSTGDRNSALKNIFGSDAIRAGTILLKDGSAGLAQMATDFGKFGSAADVARIKMDNLSGDVEQFTGSIETAMIGLGEGGSGPLRSFVQGATDAVNAFNDLGSGTKSTLLAVGAGLATIALGAAGLGKVAIFASEAKVALTALGISARAAGVAMLGITAAVGIGAIAYSRYAEQAAASRQSVDDFKAALDGQTESINQNTIAVANKKLEDAGALKAAQDLGLSLDTVTQASLGNAAAQEVVRSRLAAVKAVMDEQIAAGTGAADATGEQSAAYGVLQKAVFGTSEEFRKAVESQQRLNDANEASADTLGSVAAAVEPDAYVNAATALGQVGSEAGDAAGEVRDLTAALFEQGNAALGLSNAQIGYEQAVDAAKAAVKGMTEAQIDSGKAGDVTTKLGQQSQTVLNRLAGQTQAYAQSLVDQGKGAKAAAGATADGRKQFIATAKAMGIGGAAARQMANDYGLVPKKVETKIEAKAEKAKAEVATVKGLIKGLPKKTQAEIIAALKKGGLEAAKAALDKAAKKRQAEIEAKARGDAEVKRRLDEAAKDRKSQIRVTDVGTGAASSDISEAARDRRATINVSASGVGATQSAINSIKGGQVEVVIHRSYTGRDDGATGGLMTHAGFVARGPLQRSNGGPVWGAGTATSDSIPAMLSNGEFVIRAAAVKAVGIAKLKDLNAQGYASGGPVGLAAGGPVGADALAILKYMAAVLNPLADVNKARRKIAEARDDKQDADTKKERRKADRELTAATKDLKEAQKAAAESMRQTADALADPYRSKSHDIDDWLESMRTGKEDLAKFQDQVGKLRKLGVSEAIIKQITDQGAIVGSELAQQIIDGGSELAKSLNKANTDLQKASQNLAYTATVKPKGHAAGGPISGPGSGTSDSITARLSNGEWVVPAHAVGANRSMLEAITYGRAAPQPRFMPGFAFGGPVASTVTREYRGGDVIIRDNVIADPDLVLRRARAAQRDSQTMFGLTVGV